MHRKVESKQGNFFFSFLVIGRAGFVCLWRAIPSEGIGCVQLPKGATRTTFSPRFYFKCISCWEYVKVWFNGQRAFIKRKRAKANRKLAKLIWNSKLYTAELAMCCLAYKPLVHATEIQQQSIQSYMGALFPLDVVTVWHWPQVNNEKKKKYPVCFDFSTVHLISFREPIFFSKK